MRKKIILVLATLTLVLTITTGSVSNVWFVTDKDTNNKVITVKTKDGCFVEDYTAEVGGVTIIAEAGTSFANYKVIKECVLSTPDNFRKYITDVTLTSKNYSDSSLAHTTGSFETGSFTASIQIKDPKLINHCNSQIVYATTEINYWHEVGHIISYACSLYNDMELVKDRDGFDDACGELWSDQSEDFSYLTYWFQCVSNSKAYNGEEETWAEAFGIYMSGKENGTTGKWRFDYDEFIENYPLTCEYIENYLDEIGWYNE